MTGKPRFRLKIGDKKRWAKYAGADESGATLTFAYAVKEKDADADGVSIGKNQLRLNGGSIADADGNAARLKHPALSDQAGHRVNGAPDEPPEPTPTPTPTPEPVNSAPQFAAETAARSVDENSPAGANVGGRLTAEDPDGDTLTYSLDGSDAFTIDAAGQVAVASGTALDHETRASHSVTVTAADPDGATDSIEVTISVTNLDEPGTVSLSADAPEAGSALTAELTDPDGGITGLAWTWDSSADGNEWEAIAGETGPAYTPANEDAGRFLRATASYSDAEGGGKTARAASAGTVTPVIIDPPPSVVAGPLLNSPGSGDTYGAGDEVQVSLTFSEPVAVSGQPRVGVIIGENRRWARYDRTGADGATLVFAYEVRSGDRDDDGLRVRKNALRLNGGSIEDYGGNAAILQHPTGAGLKVDGSASPTQAPESLPQMAASGVTVSANWPLIPKDGSNNPRFTVGQSFRLLFITSTTRNAASTNIADYNSFVQTAANNNTALRPFKGEFRVVGSTATVDARDNTATRFTGDTTTTDQTDDSNDGVPIYWVGGDKVADYYKDFYDGSWDSYSGKTEAGTVFRNLRIHGNAGQRDSQFSAVGQQPLCH